MKVCVTGHRPNKLWGYDLNNKHWQELKQVFKDYLIQHSVSEAYSGMALGVDTVFALAVLELKQEGFPIKLYCAIPCLKQEKMWPQSSQDLYHTILEKADRKFLVTKDTYKPYLMQVRNQFMVNHSDRVLAVWDGTSGGTKNCVTYAKQKEIPVDRIYPNNEKLLVQEEK